MAKQIAGNGRAGSERPDRKGRIGERHSGGPSARRYVPPWAIARYIGTPSSARGNRLPLRRDRRTADDGALGIGYPRVPFAIDEDHFMPQTCEQRR